MHNSTTHTGYFGKGDGLDSRNKFRVIKHVSVFEIIVTKNSITMVSLGLCKAAKVVAMR